MSAPVPAEVIHVTACPLCGAGAPRVMFEEPPHTVLRCSACTMVWVTPRMSAEGLREVYREGYWNSESPKSRGYADYRRDEPLYLRTFRKRLEFVGQWLGPPGRLLDVGCAAGFFLEVATEAGWKVDGVELSAEIASCGAERFGFDHVHIGTLDSAPFAPATFDVITMWDVVEHVPEPAALLARARQLLKPAGRLLIETQNVASLFAKLLGRRWQHYKHDEHLYHFNPTTISTLLAQNGFGVVAITPRLGGKYVSLGFIAERSARLHPLAAKLASPLNRWGDRDLYLNFRDEMIVIAEPV